MDKQLLEELINDMAEILANTTGETKQVAYYVREQLKRILQGE